MNRLSSLATLVTLAASLLVPAVGSAQPIPVAPPPMPTTSDLNWPAERPPRPLQAASVKFPEYEMHTLPNGLRVVIVQQHEQPNVTLRMVVRAGAAYDPKDKAGVATVVASLLDQGTTTRTAQQIADTIDFIGGGLGAGAGTDLSYVNVIIMKDSLDLGLNLLSDVMRHPAFANEELARQREQILSGLKVSYDDPDYVANAVIDRLIYGFHPYGRPSSGTPDSVSSITHEDLVAFHRAYFVPNNSIMAVVGDVDPAESLAMVTKVFGDWEKREVPAFPMVEPPPPARRALVIDRPDSAQTEIRVGQLAIPRNHPDYLALNVAINILGGEGGNRLQGVLRSDRGLTYGASADMHTYKRAGGIIADTDTRTETTAEALRVVVDEIARLQRERVGDAELSNAQAYLSGNFPLTIETPDSIAMQVLNSLFYELDLKELETYRERVNAITADDIQRVAKQYLKPSNLSVVLVGDATKFVKQLKGVGFDNVEMISLSDLDLTTGDFHKARSGSPTAKPGDGGAK
jgi:zinc protease